MMDKVREFGHEHLIPLAFDFADDGTVLHRDPKTLLIGQGADDAEADAYVSSLGLWNGTGMSQPLTECARREIPVTFIYTTQDMTMPLDYQKSIVEKMRAEGRDVDTVELETSHSPNLTKANEVVDAINEVAARTQA